MQSDIDQSNLRAHRFPQAIRFLRALGVPATRLAGIFDDSADNVSHIRRRASQTLPLRDRPELLEKDDWELLRLTTEQRSAQVRRNLQGIRLRTKADWQHLEQAIWSIFRKYGNHHLEDGYSALRLMRPSAANARRGHALVVRLLLEERLAWFALNLHAIDDALASSKCAMQLALEAFRESAGDKTLLHRYGEAALIASICLQKKHAPRASHRFIKAADAANIAAGLRPGSEHLRQLGAAMLQAGSHDDRAVNAFKMAEERMRQRSEAANTVDLRMVGLRQRALLTPEDLWDDVQLMLSDVAASYGAGSVQFEVATRFSAAAGFKLASPSATLRSQQLLAALPSSPLATLLAITPELRLSGDSLDRWLRFALYETPSRHK